MLKYIVSNSSNNADCIDCIFKLSYPIAKSVFVEAKEVDVTPILCQQKYIKNVSICETCLKAKLANETYAEKATYCNK